MVAEGEEIILIGDGGTLIRTAVDNISVQGRSATGVRVMNVNDGHHVAAVARVLAGDDEDTDMNEDGEPIEASADELASEGNAPAGESSAEEE